MGNLFDMPTEIVVPHELVVVDYSKYGLAVMGETYKYKDGLKSLGGRFNRNLKASEYTGGWIFSKIQHTEILYNWLMENKIKFITIVKENKSNYCKSKVKGGTIQYGKKVNELTM